MRPTLLILGGTSEASRLATRVAEMGLDATLSYAGRVSRPLDQPVPTRTGGFGGPDGLAAYLSDNAITHLVDATHPFAAGISHNAVQAASTAGVPLLALTRPPWSPVPGDQWTHVKDIQSAAQTIGNDRKTVFLGIGRQEAARFAAAPRHRYVLRVIDPPDPPAPLPDHVLIQDRGPFTLAGDLALLKQHRVDVVVSKNSGGTAARAKLDAARDLGLPVIMVDRPDMPDRHETHSVDRVIDWLTHAGTDLGV